MATAAPTPGPNTTTSNTGPGGGISVMECPKLWINRDSIQAKPQMDMVSCSLKNEPEGMGNRYALRMIVHYPFLDERRTY